VFTNAIDFESALISLSKTPLVTDVYYTIAGIKPGQGERRGREREREREREGGEEVEFIHSFFFFQHCVGAVISRNAMNASDIWMLNAPSTWYLVQVSCRKQ
jgi:hypothetical protein